MFNFTSDKIHNPQCISYNFSADEMLPTFHLQNIQINGMLT